MTAVSPTLFLPPGKHHPRRCSPVTLSLRGKMSEHEITLDRPDCHMLVHSYVDAAPRPEREGDLVAGDETSLLVDDAARETDRRASEWRDPSKIVTHLGPHEQIDEMCPDRFPCAGKAEGSQVYRRPAIIVTELAHPATPQ